MLLCTFKKVAVSIEAEERDGVDPDLVCTAFPHSSPVRKHQPEVTTSHVARTLSLHLCFS
jgi:hypothetical protein